MASLPLGIRLLPHNGGRNRDVMYKAFILVFTFFCYTSYHLSRKPISIVKAALHPKNCSANATECGWAPFEKSNYSDLFGYLDLTYLFAYAVGMFASGHIAERMSLRHFLSSGMLLSGFFTAAFGFGYFFNIHAFWFYMVIQLFGGFVQSTGWPSVVACVGNWYGKGKRGLIMGLWNSHTSVGNILGSLIAGAWVNHAWGWSFVVPGIIIGSVGVLTYFFLVTEPSIVGCAEPPRDQGKEVDGDEASEEAPLLRRPDTERTEAVSLARALFIPGVIEFSLCLFFAKLVSYTFLFWLPNYISNKTTYSAEVSGDLSTFFDVGGIAGGIVAGLVSDLTGGRATTCVVMLILGAPMMFIYNLYGSIDLTHSIVLLLLLGFLVNGPYALITTAVSADLGTHKSLKGNAKALATVTAIIDGTGSIGAAIGPLLAGLISKSGWNNVFYMLIASDILAMVFLVRLVFKEIIMWRVTVAERSLEDEAVANAVEVSRSK